MATITNGQILGLNTITYLPSNFDVNKAYPCLVFLPGAGEINGPISLLMTHGPFQYLKSGVDLGLNLIVIAIQNVNANPRPAEIQAYVTAIKKLYHISALIGSGLSRGGQDWMWYANNSESQLQQLAALVLFSSQGTVSDMPSIPGTYNPSLYVKNNVAVWQGCGTMDSFYDARKAEYNALYKIESSLATWTEWPGAGHGDPVWSDGYNPAWTKNSLGMSIYTWAAKFGASVVVPPPPVVIPPPVVVPPVTPPKTIKSITIVYTDGSSESKP